MGSYRPKNLVIELVPPAFKYGFGLSQYLRQQVYEILTVLGESYSGGDEVPEGNLWASKMLKHL